MFDLFHRRRRRFRCYCRTVTIIQYTSLKYSRFVFCFSSFPIHPLLLLLFDILAHRSWSNMQQQQ